MLDSLRFVQGAVAKKDYTPELTHFRIRNGRILGHNGLLSLSCPIDLDLDVLPRATPFIKAIQTCRDTITMHVTPTGKLSIKSGNFKALVDCINEGFPEVEPEGTTVAFKGEIIKTLKTLEPFIAEDASRPWARGILFRGESAFATNNIIIMEKWLGQSAPLAEVNIPHAAVNELIRIGEEPEKMQVSDASATFHFSGGRWLKTQLYSSAWPDIGRVLNAGNEPKQIPQGLFTALEDLKPFANKLEQVFLTPGKLTTEATDDAQGAVVECLDIKDKAIFNLYQLLSLQKVITAIDFSNYPKPCLFVGDLIRGAIVGMRG